MQWDGRIIIFITLRSGARAYPPEDYGGIDGYYNVVQTLADRIHPDYSEMSKWAGKKWHPERFDKDEITFDNPYKRWRFAFIDKK